MKSDALSHFLPSSTSLFLLTSTGIGLEFVRQLLQRRPEEKVVATCRNPSAAHELQDLVARHPDRLSVVGLDTSDPQSIENAANEVSQMHSHVNMLLNVSGLLHIPGVIKPETNLQRCSLESLERIFTTNAFGPLLCCQQFEPLLQAAGGTEEHPAVIANLSARVGSITDNRLGGWYAYRASKAALNQLSKTMSVEFARRKKNRISVVLLHPGTTDTDLSKPYHRNVPPEQLFSKERTVRQLLEILDGVGMKDTGKFFAWDGKIIPW